MDHEEKTSNFFLQPEGYGNGSAASEADSQFRGGVCPSSVQYLHWKDAGPGSGKLRWNRDHFRIYGDISVFVAQNRGAGDKKRALKGFHQGLGLMIVFVIILSVLQATLTRGAVQLLMGNPSETVMKNAVLYMNVVSVFYILNFIGNAGVGFFRGIGKISVPVIGSTLHISIRVVLSYLLIGRMGLEAVAFATGIGWISVVLYQILVYRKVRKKGFI